MTARLVRVILNATTLIACGVTLRLNRLGVSTETLQRSDGDSNKEQNEAGVPREEVVEPENQSSRTPHPNRASTHAHMPETGPHRNDKWRETSASPRPSRVSEAPPLNWELGLSQRVSDRQACMTEGGAGPIACCEDPGMKILADDRLLQSSWCTDSWEDYKLVSESKLFLTHPRFFSYLPLATASHTWLPTSNSPSERIALSMSDPPTPSPIDSPRIIAPLPCRPRTQRVGGLLGHQRPLTEPTREDLQAATALTELRRPTMHVISNGKRELGEIAHQMQSPFGFRPFDPSTTVLGHYGLHIARPDMFPFSRVGDVEGSRPIPAVFNPHSPMDMDPLQERVPTPRPSVEETRYREPPEGSAVHVLHYRLGRLHLESAPVSPTDRPEPPKQHVNPSRLVDPPLPIQPSSSHNKRPTPEDPTALLGVSGTDPDTRICDGKGSSSLETIKLDTLLAQPRPYPMFRRDPPTLVPPNMLPTVFPELQRFVEAESPNPFRAQFLQQTVRAWEKSLLHLAFFQFLLQSFAAIIGYVNERNDEEEQVEERARAQYQHQWQALHRESGENAARTLLQAFPNADYHARPFSMTPSVLMAATSDEAPAPADPVVAPLVEPSPDVAAFPAVVLGPAAPMIPVDPRFAETDVLESLTPNIESQGGEWVEADAVGEDDDGGWISCGSMPNLESVSGSSESESDSASASSISNCPPLLPISSYPPRFAMVHPTASALPVLPPIHGAAETDNKVPAYDESYDHRERLQGWLAEIRQQQANGHYREAQATCENAVNFLLQRAANPYPSLQDVNEDPFPHYMDGVPTLLSLVTLDGNTSSDSPPPRSPDYFESWDFLWYVQNTDCPTRAKTPRSETPEAMSDNGSSDNDDNDKDALMEPLENIIHTLFFDDDPQTPARAPIRRSSGSISPPVFRSLRGLPGERMAGQSPALVALPYVGLVFIPPSPALSLASPASTFPWERNDPRFEKYHPGFRNYHPWWSTTHTPFLTMDKYEAAGAFDFAPYDGDTLPPPPLDTPPVSPSSEEEPNYDNDESDGGQGKAEHLQELRSTIIAREGLRGLVTRLDQVLAPHLQNHQIERAQTFGALFQLRDIVYGKTNLGPLYDAAQCRLLDGQKTSFISTRMCRTWSLKERFLRRNDKTFVRDFRQVFGAVIEQLFALAARAGIDLRKCYYQFLEHHRCDYRACWFYHHPILTPVEHAQGEIAYMALHRLGYYLQADVLSRCLRVQYLPEAESVIVRMQNDESWDQPYWTNEIPGLPCDDLFKYLDEDALYAQAEEEARGHGIELASGASSHDETRNEMSVDTPADSHTATGLSHAEAPAHHDESTSIANDGFPRSDDAELDRPPDIAEQLPDLANLPDERTLQVFARNLAPEIYLTTGYRKGIIPVSELPDGFQLVPADHCDLLLALLWDDPEDFKDDLWARRHALNLA
ncbi:hypothetical protein C8F01DRAFT_1080489 [Mycena amicta]|nr:hypothetical protein C8F01DRAFT_1080489 [Mycena amicta]